MSSLFRKDRNQIYRCIPLERFAWLEHGFTTRLAIKSAVPSVVTLRQIHSADVLNAGNLLDRECSGDALVTDKPQQAIGVRTADCVPILLVDARSQAVAAVHAGWRGTAASIVRQTLTRMTGDFGTRPSDVHAAIGPAIGSCCYEVGDEVAEQFRAFRERGAVSESEHGRPMLDLVRINASLIEAAGVPTEQIYSAGLCTKCVAGYFHSYRRDPNDPGRMVAFVRRVE